MAQPMVSVFKKKKKKNQPSLVLTLSTAALLVGGGIAAYCIFSQGQTSSSDLPVGANIIPQDALFAVSLTTDSQQWQKLREFGTKETQAELDKNLGQLRNYLQSATGDRIFANNGYNFQKDIQPWVGNEITIAVLAPPTANNPPPKPVGTEPISSPQSIVMILPIKNPEIAKSFLAQPKPLKQGKWIDRTYEGIAIKQSQGVSGESNFSAALLDGRFLVIADNPEATERAIDAYTTKVSLATTGGLSENFPKVANYQSLAKFYVNIPTAARIAATAPNHPLPAQVLAQLQNNQGLAGTVSLEPEGIHFRGVSWLNPHSQRHLVVENQAVNMQDRVPGETLMMLSGSNLQHLWADYISTSVGNPLAPITPEKLRQGVKSLTNLDLERDLLSWMKGEFSLSLVPTTPVTGSPEDVRTGLVFMVQTSDRQAAETTLHQLDDVVKNQYQFKIQPGIVASKPVVNWVSPYGTLAATHGWLDGDVAFLAIGAPITDKIVPSPNHTLASTLPFQQTVPKEPNPANGQFFLDVDRTAKSFTLSTLFPKQETLLAATRSIGVTTSVNDSLSNRYDIFIALKKVSDPAK